MAGIARPELLDDELLKMMNLAHDWLESFLPFILSKIDRVSFGLLSADEIAKQFAADPKMPPSRKITAVPFVGKDVPSRRSEFAHLDIVIGLTIMAYRYEGLRAFDFRELMKSMQASVWEEYGPYHKRPSSRQFQVRLLLAFFAMCLSVSPLRLSLKSVCSTSTQRTVSGGEQCASIVWEPISCTTSIKLAFPHHRSPICLSSSVAIHYQHVVISLVRFNALWRYELIILLTQNFSPSV